ncbi:hypothetical protein [Nocardia vinacea]|uniref:hypothetical protein n=1 Tax=Nocardia vinacea TaxID=96468 RepID=UPI0012F6F5D5|nr:hypothetical protein [Nocardia vinacea]
MMISGKLSGTMRSVRESLSRLFGKSSESDSENIRNVSDSAGETARAFETGDHEGDRSLRSQDFSNDMEGAPTANAGISAPEYVARGRDLVDDLDYRSIHTLLDTRRDDPYLTPAEREAGSSDGDSALGAICHSQGFDGLPSVVEREGVDAVVDAGGRELFRGLSDSSHVEQFKSGDYFPGSASHVLETGNGTYVSTVRSDALDYAGNNGDRVIRMALRPDSRTIEFGELREEHQATLRQLSDEAGRLRGIIRITENPSQEMIGRSEELQGKLEVLSDPGRYAAARGYQAYDTGRSGFDHVGNYWVVLDRTALVVQR